MICKVLSQNLTIELQENETLFSALQKVGAKVFAPCGGKGICGKCAIRLVAGNLAITAEDKKIFSEEQLASGYRLSCTAIPTENIVIEIENADHDLAQASASVYGLGRIKTKPETKDILAIDIGTTTIAFAWISGADKKVKKTYTTTNHQRAYGADVIARILAAGEGKAGELKALVKKDIVDGVKAVIQDDNSENTEVIITGNTTMEHLLLGYDVSGLGVYPFTPISVDEMKTDWKSLFDNDDYDMPVTVMPGFTTYVGADILAGVMACDMGCDQKNTVLIDLGTNGEMALATSDKLFITSTAAGPAFEGGNISCGMPGVEGAVSEVFFENDEFKVKTINDGVAKGICGSGIIDAIACMVENEILDETGLLDDDYFDDGVELTAGVVLIQKDIREMQLAKSSVRAGLETLIKKAGLSYDDINQVYLAGGFGQYINIDSAVSIGLLPVQLKDKIKVVGNTALAGACLYGLVSDTSEAANVLKEKAEEIDLSTDPTFQEGYMTYIMFEE